MRVLILYSNWHLRKIHDEVVSVGLFGSFYNLFHGDSTSAVSDVLSDCSCEQNRFLFHYTNKGAQPLDIQASDVVTIQGDLKMTTINADTFFNSRSDIRLFVHWKSSSKFFKEFELLYHSFFWIIEPLDELDRCALS